MVRSQGISVRRLVATAIAVLVGPAAFAVAVAPPANAYSSSVSLGVPCGKIRSNTAGQVKASYDYTVNSSRTKLTVSNRTSTARTYECTRGTSVSINEIWVRTQIKFGGVGITGCSVGTGAASCVGGPTSKTVSLPWFSGLNVSTRTQTLNSASFTALTVYSMENLVHGRFIHGDFDRNYVRSRYCYGPYYRLGSLKWTGCSNRTA